MSDSVAQATVNAQATPEGSAAPGMQLAPGVMETIISMAASDVDGVSGVGSAKRSRGLFGSSKPAYQGVDVLVGDDGNATVGIHLNVRYGHVLPDVAASVRQAIAEALLTQVGVDATQIDIYVDSIEFD